MKYIYRKSILSLLTFSLSIHCCPASSDAAANSGNEYLDMDISQLMQITITSVSKKPQNLSDTAAAVFVITQNDIHQSGVTSIPEALRMVPGLQVARVSSSRWAITSRGFAGNFANKLLVMIDGRTVYSPAFSGVYWDVQDTMLEDIDRIEVIRGPGATIWGANAVNGVINIITKNAADTQGGLAYAGGGNEEQFMGGLRYGTRIGESIHGRAYLTYHKQDSFRIHETGEDASDGWHSFRTGFRMDGVVGSENSWNLQGDIYSNNENQILTPFWQLQYPYRTFRHDNFEATGWNMLGRWQKDLSRAGTWTVQAYYDYTHRDELILKQTHRTVDLELQYQNRLDKRNNLVMGLEYRLVDADFDNTLQASVYPPERAENLYSAFIQDEIMLLPDRLWLTLGTKWEHNDFVGHEIQPSGRLLWKASDKQSVWAAVSRAVRTPSQYEEGGHITLAVVPTSLPAPLVITLSGNEQYKSEELIAYEAGYRWLPLTTLSFDFAVYYNDYDNLRTTDLAPARSLSKYTLTNKMYGSTHGLELASDWQPVDWMKLQLGYTYIGFDLKVDADSISQALTENTKKASPRHQVSLQSSIDVDENLQLNLWARYVGTLDSSDKTLIGRRIKVDEYLTLDVNVAWRLKEGLELMLVGQNLLNSSHPEYVSEFSAQPTEVERSVYAKLTYQF